MREKLNLHNCPRWGRFIASTKCKSKVGIYCWIVIKLGSFCSMECYSIAVGVLIVPVSDTTKNIPNEFHNVLSFADE